MRIQNFKSDKSVGAKWYAIRILVSKTRIAYRLCWRCSYKMRFVYADFPINAGITNENRGIEIRDFLGVKKLILDYPFCLIYVLLLGFRVGRGANPAKL
ncbi:hypothetical protein GIB67_030026 [Kingdonia uniflora]|uniref:Uncharacterized protein n=1 Tax=Kingdonia uniflora TaxID=39325 RepID=A0A7J7MYK9_9MAGN|nr:hypothetical protein GIB67_030026 [Kingdonia uniflora]